MKTLWIIANWKSNKTISEALDWISVVGPKVPGRGSLHVVVCPTFIDIEEVKKAVLVGNLPLVVGSQDLSPFGDGPYTGEESARILSELVNLSILGHSERRQNFGETDEMVEAKVKQAAQFNIIPLVCIQDKNTPIPENVKMVAYEPVFAIGTGHPDTPDNAQSTAVSVKERCGEGVQVLYGGSVNEKNAKAFLQQPAIDGLLIGGASLDPEQFLKIVEIASQCCL